MKRNLQLSVAIIITQIAILSIGCNSYASEHNEVSPLSKQLQKLNLPSGRWVKYHQNPVISTGPEGSWDAGALGSMTVLKVGDTFHLYYEAWGVRSEKEWDAAEYESLQIGHATSTDGIHWTKDPHNPVLPRGAQGQWDRTGTWDPFVIYEDGLFKMWYGGGGGGKPCDWAFAVSKDGSSFTKKGQISHLGHVEDCHVVHDKNSGRYYMYYWDRRFEPRALFRASSHNETDFDFNNATPIKIQGEDYPAMYKFTHVLHEADTWYMFYGNFVRPHCPDSTVRLATSTDGLHWTSRNKNLLEGHDAEVLKAGDNLYLMFFGPRNHFDAKDCDIRLAFYKGALDDLAESAIDVTQDLSFDDDKAYNEFYKRVQADEPYIGFFAAEKKCIKKVDEAYKKARRRFFLGVSVSDEEVEGYMRRFIKFCKDKGYLNDGCEEGWQKTLMILSYELYANMPVFEFSADNIIEHRDLIFAEYPNKKLALDLFLPAEPLDEPVPCVVCIHGGAWRVNRRLWYEPFAAYLASKGFAAVTIDYRMLPAVKIIDCVYDTKAAVRWVRANADKYGIDPDRIGALGASAGAQLVALLATTADVPELEGSGGNPGVSSAIQAGVCLATPAFKIDTIKPEFLKWFNFSLEELKLVSPYENISSSSAPLFLLHGTEDEVVDPQDSQDLYDKYKEVGAHAELKWVPDEGHDFYEGTDFGIELATEFFKAQFGLQP
jgi:acetyl esterase/lipase